MCPQQDPETLSMRWDDALKNGDFDGALHVALQGYLAARANEDRVSALMFLGFVKHAANVLFSKSSVATEPSESLSDRCSFCLKKNRKLVRGVGVAICPECIDLAKSAIG
jgi:ClpX C4-type zinc finger